MIPDYVAFDIELETPVYYEFKGVEMPTYRLKRKLWMCYGPAPLWVYKKKGKNTELIEIIIPDHGEEE